MKILHYVNESRLAWAAPYVQLLVALEKLGAQNTVICAPGGTLSGMLEAAGIPRKTAKPLFPWFPPACVGIARIISDEQPEIIVTRLSSASLIGGYWGKRLSIPVVGVLDKFSKKKYYGAVDCVQTVSTALLEYAKDESFPPSTLIPNGIATGRYRAEASSRLEARNMLGIEREEMIIAAAGRFVDWKGFDILLEAFGRTSVESHETRRTRLLLPGDGEERAHLMEIARAHGVETRTLFPGFVRDIRPYLWASDVFVLPSKEPEPFGIVLLEAMASGLPVIATDFGGPRDMIEHGVSGWLVAPKSAEALADALETALQHPDLRTIGCNASEAAQRFDLEKVAQESIKLYQHCIKTRNID